MACIYKITNLVNDKVYIGKTLKTAEERWKEHCREYKKERCEKRPLYRAMNKYGIENFVYETIEECTVENINDREIYWIEYYGSFHYGYNATRGGDGTSYVNYDLVYRLFLEGNTVKQIHLLTGHDCETITKILKNNGVLSEEIQQRARDLSKVSVIMIDKDTDEVLQIFPSMQEAVRHVGERNSSHIAAACQGKRKTVRGYKWQYANENNDS